MDTPRTVPARRPEVRWGRPPIPASARANIVMRFLAGDTKYRIAKTLGINRMTVHRYVEAAKSIGLEPVAA